VPASGWPCSAPASASRTPHSEHNPGQSSAHNGASGSSSTTDEIVDLRKNELLSAVPWLNRWLLRIEVAPKLRLLLYQSDLTWTVGLLILFGLFAATGGLAATDGLGGVPKP